MREWQFLPTRRYASAVLAMAVCLCVTSWYCIKTCGWIVLVCVLLVRLRSASSNQLDVPSFRLPTVGSRTFPIAGAKVWNSLPDDVTSALSLSTFRRHLKTYLFRCCYNTD